MVRYFLFFVILSVFACGKSKGPGRVDAGNNPIIDGGFVCLTEESSACLNNSWFTCKREDEFLTKVEDKCGERDQQCVSGIGCTVCRPDSRFCRDNDVVLCNSAGDAFEVVEECELSEGFVCRDAQCQKLCDIAIADRSYQGCEFYAVDLDNAAIGAGRDASSQQYAIVVSNPSPLATDIVVEVNDAPYGEEIQPREVESVTLLPGDLEVFRLPRREVDGSSSNRSCTPAGEACPGDETCVCGGAPPCFCRVSESASGLNDGSHTRVSSQAYRIRSKFPIIAYQFNPLDNVGVFSNDASLLIPTSAQSTSYTVVGWPQTIADGDCDVSMPSCREVDFDPARDDEDLRAFLTVVGGPARSIVDVTLGEQSVKVVGNSSQGFPSVFNPGDELNIELGPFDVLNLETDGFNGDFTGTRVRATMPVGVFVGSEASDAPRFDSYSNRSCCADHLEEQLFGDETLGTSFMIARMPPRTAALNESFYDPFRDSVAQVNEPEWVRVLAVASGETTITTTLPAPNDRVVLSQYESMIFEATQDFLMDSLDGKPIAVLQALPSQARIGVPTLYPGGDPSIIAIPPEEQYRQDYVFLTPDQYAFDFLVITADADTQILLDGEALDPARCTVSPADGIERSAGDPPPERVIHRCQLSFPEVGRLCEDEDDPECQLGNGGGLRRNIRDGEQNDGVHTVVANEPVGIVVYGFDAYVSYAYAAGLNLKPIVR